MAYLFFKFQTNKFISWHTPAFANLNGFKQGKYLYLEDRNPNIPATAAVLMEWDTKDQAQNFMDSHSPVLENFLGPDAIILECKIFDDLKDIIQIQLDFNFPKETVDIQIMNAGPGHLCK